MGRASPGTDVFSVTADRSDAECFSLRPGGLMDISRWRKPPVNAEKEQQPQGATE